MAFCCNHSRRWCGLMLGLTLAACSERSSNRAVRASALHCGTGARRIACENSLPGTSDWQIQDQDAAINREIEGYADALSANAGSAIRIAVNTRPAGTYSYQVFRTGYYGGAGARLMAQGGPLAGTEQVEPGYDPVTGLVEVYWPESFEIVTADGDAPWPSGVYLVKLTKSDGKQIWCLFILRDDHRDAEVLMQVSSATWQAYNSWGGESLYTSEHGLGRAVKVSYNRPYGYGYGAGGFTYQEYPMVQWLEKHGYDVEYASNLDAGGAHGRVGGHRLFVSVAHDEYGTIEALDRFQAALARGVSFAFLTGDTMYWQVRYEDSPAGSEKVEVCYRDPLKDPLYGIDNLHVTTQFRGGPVYRPENSFLGVLSQGDDINRPMDWIVTNSSHWVYTGTGLKDGDVIAGAIFNEWDGLEDNGSTPDGIVALSDSDVYPGHAHQNATIYERGNAFVFAGGSIYLSQSMLDEDEGNRYLATVMQNLLARSGASQYGPITRLAIGR